MSGYQPLVQLPSNVLDALQIFANTAWHNPIAFLRTHHSSTSRDVEYFDVQNHSVALQYLFGNAVAKCNKILVRDEYREALRALQSDSAYERGAFIIGQPGIGKTCFLIYALINRLSEYKPVAMQLRASDPFYAFFTHTCMLCPLSDPASLVEEDVWALSDLRVSTNQPLDIFLDISAKVIQATPCSTKHWERWSEHQDAAMFVMNIWSVEEIADLSSLSGFDVEHMTTLAIKWGGVPRMLLHQSKNSESQQRWELRRAVVSVLENRTVLHTLNAQDVSRISAIFFVLPPKDRAGNVRHRRYVILVPTEMLQNALVIELQQMQSAARADFFLFMFDHSETWGGARSIYVNWFCSQMISGNGFSCSWFNHYNHTHSRLSSELRDATQVNNNTPIIFDVTKITETTGPCLWIGLNKEIPGIDCVVFTDSAIFAFQVYTSSRASLAVPSSSLDYLKTFLPKRWKNNQNTHWIFSFVAISQKLLGSASAYWPNRPSSVCEAGTCVVDPTQNNVPYKAYTYDDRDGSEVDY